MVVHVVRGDGLSGVSAPQMGKVRELATSLGATVHTVVGDDVPTALLDFAREMNATQLVIGTSRRSRWARIFDEGIGAAVVQQSGQDRRPHGHPRGGQARASRGRRSSPRQRHVASWLAALVVPSAICALIVWLLDPFLGIGGESALFFIGVLVVALLGGVAPAALSARAVRAAAELLPGRAAPHLHHRRTRQRGHHRGAAAGRGRGRRARRRRGQPGPGGHGARRRKPNCSRCSPVRCCAAPTWTRCWSGSARRIRSARSACCANGDGASRSSRASATDPCVDVDSADTAIEVGDDEFWMLMAGTQAARPRPPGADRGRQAGRGPGQAARADRGGRQGRGDRTGRRTAPLTAVGRQPRPAHTAGRRQGRGVQPAQRRRRLLRRGHRRTAGHHRGVDRPAHRAGRQPARLVAAGRRCGAARTAPGLPGGDGAARPARNQQGHHRFSPARHSTGSRSKWATPSRWPTAACSSGCWPT